jgi:hypothetical protein
MMSNNIFVHCIKCKHSTLPESIPLREIYMGKDQVKIKVTSRCSNCGALLFLPSPQSKN